MAVSLGPSCPCWRRPAASPPLKLWRGTGAAREPPWLKADSPSLPVDCATLLTTCCPGPPRSCGRRQRPARLDHGFDVGIMSLKVRAQLRPTASHKALYHHHQTPSSHYVDSLESLHRHSNLRKELWARDSLNPAPVPSYLIPEARTLCFSQLSFPSVPPAARSTSTHLYVSSSNHAVATAGAVLPPTLLRAAQRALRRPS